MSWEGNIGGIENEAGPITQRIIKTLVDKIKKLENQLSSISQDAQIGVSHADLEDLEYANAGHIGFASSAALTDHINGADPHPGYLTQAEGDAIYVPQTTQVIAGSGLIGGGALSQDRTIHAQVGSGLYLQADLFGFSTTFGDSRYALSGTVSGVAAGDSLLYARGFLIGGM